MNIEGGGQQVFLIQTNRLAVGTPKKMALSFIFSVEVAGISGEEVPHGPVEVVLLGTDQQVDMVGHEAEGIEGDLRLLNPVFQPPEQEQVILILESMKMQNELKSPKAGTVGRIRVKQGEKVEQRQALLSVQ
jgi:multidrug efflux pump subunit AcrA (membrane-fusion protein)